MALLALISAHAGLAQTAASEILGRVTDATSAGVVGAKVTDTHVATGHVQTQMTNQDGDYTFALVDIGEHTVKVEKEGFLARTVTGLRVETQQKARIDFALEVGSVKQNVEVVAQAVVLDTENAAVGQVIDNQRVVDLPLNGRNIIQLAVMAPGVQYGLRSGLGDGQTGFPIQGEGMSVIADGQREVHESITLDGIESIMPVYNISTFNPSIDAIEEFRVQTGLYSAEFGYSSGARVEVTMKSGTNQFHGTLFEFLRNDALDAKSYFLNFQIPANATLQKKNRLRRNQFGTFAGGPIIPNRTFWSFDYEGRRESNESVATTFWPNQDFRSGNFSTLLTPATNPSTGRPFRASIAIFDPLTGMPFPNNILPASRISPGALNVMNKYIPLPDFQQADVLAYDVSRNVALPITADQYFGRLDHNLTSRDKLFGRVALQTSNQVAHQINPNFPQFKESDAYNVATGWVHTFSPSILNEFRFGINNWGDNFTSPRTNTNFDINSLGIGQYHVVGDGNRNLTPLEQGVPTMSFSGSGFSLGDVQGRLDNSWSYQSYETLSINRGKHLIKTGGSFVHVAGNRLAANLTQGTLAFSSNESGYDFASFLLGYPDASQTPQGYPGVNMRSQRFGGFATDDWKVTPKLSVSFGFRFDYLGNPYDLLGQVRTLSFLHPYTTSAGQQVPTLYPIPRSSQAMGKIWDQAPGYAQPRLGIAYRPASKWVIRTGAGRFTSPEHFVQISTANLQPPLAGSYKYNNLTVPVAGGATRMFSPGASVYTLDAPFGATPTLGPQIAYLIQPDRKERDVWQWNFDIQRELPGGAVLDVGYVGSKTTHSANSVGGINEAQPSLNTNFQALRPYPFFYDPASPALGLQQLGQLQEFDASANQHYQALQVKVSRQFKNGFAAGLAYSYSKANGDGEDGGNENGGRQIAANRANSRAVTSFNLTHNAVINFVWDVPFGKTLHGVPGVLLKGWQTNGIISLRTGFPWTPTEGSNDLNTGGDGDPVRPDRLQDGRLSNPTRQLWFNPQAFQRTSCNIASRPDLCHFGSAGRNIMTSPGQRNLDGSVFKNFVVNERVKLQFRTELFNAFNTPYFGQPTNIGFVSNQSIVPDAPNQGQITNLRGSMRVIQFGLKVIY